MVTEVKLDALWNAYAPIVVTELGMIIEVVTTGTYHSVLLTVLYNGPVKPEPMNTFWPIDVTDAGMVIDVKDRHS